MRQGISTVVCVAVACLAFIAPAEARTVIGTFGDWAAIRQDGAEPMCYIVAEPQRTRASVSNIRRGAASLSIGIWPERGVDGQVQASFGFEVDGQKGATLAVGSRTFKLLADGETAWAPDTASDAAIISALRQNGAVETTGVSRRGTKVTDRYSLQGFSAALSAVRSACGGKSGR